MSEERPIVRRKQQQRHAVAGTGVVASGLVLAALPLFMVGGLAVQIKDEFGLTESGLGAAVTMGFVVGALSAPFGGRLADRIGAAKAIYLGGLLSVLSLLGLGLLADGWGTLVVFLCLAGLAVALTDPGLAILVNRVFPESRQGLAFGIKEASVPAATLAAGIAVPAIALTLGWRWAFVIGLLPWLVILTLLPRLHLGPRQPESIRIEAEEPIEAAGRTALLIAAVGAALGTTAASGVGIFLTDSAVAMGMSPAGAGILLAIGGVAGIITRVGTGLLADRTGGPQFRLIALMLAFGAVTIALGGNGGTALLVLGTIGAFAGGWGWTGIFFLSLVKTNPERPGTVAGVGTAGLGVGNAAGPLLFGLVAQSFSYSTAWLAAGLTAGVASLLMTMARRHF